MRKTRKHTGLRILLLTLFLGYWANITFFTHSHIINGVKVVHSHFIFGEDPDQDSPRHTHPAKALIILSEAAAWVAETVEIPQIRATYVTGLITYPVFQYTEREENQPEGTWLRGPPCPPPACNFHA